MLYGAEFWETTREHSQNVSRKGAFVKMDSDKTCNDKLRNERIRKYLEVALIGYMIREI